MTVFYSSAEAYHVKSQREDREPGIELIRCSDGLFRTAEEKAGFDAVDMIVMTLPHS